MKTAIVLVLVTLMIMGMNIACDLASPKPTQKPGACPEVQGNTAVKCADHCSGDDTCPEEMKCCSIGCGHICMSPDLETADSP
ncbi:WAP four-disulfide core domain protein 18-like [Meriones unguiculatus]|uniref:WAP four-disulfide core domain protein 18-like n=1 Tax=Meriones unguiculatus TaxID=10047 RepID=UPI00293F5BA3|nr:WAP four-disulfide core domain protein 18-like [Meriones unguiculatus]